MRITLKLTVAMLLAGIWACGAPLTSSTRNVKCFELHHDPCAAVLTTSQMNVMAVLAELPRTYGAMAGEIIRVQEVKTNVYEVWILHEERTDVITFETLNSLECHATAIRRSERVESSRAR